MKREKLVKFIFFAALVTVGVVMCGGMAMADVQVYKNDKIDLKIYGQINRAILYANDGDGDEFYHVDNDNASTRLGLKALSKPNEKFAVGGRIEFEYQSNASDKVWQEESNTSDDEWDERIVEVFLKGWFGKVTLGQGQTASDGTSEVDLSGTKVIGSADVKDFAGGIQFFDSNTNAFSGLAVKKAFNDMDGLARADRLRYDTPAYMGFTLSVSTMSEDDDDAEDVALRYKGKLGSIKMAAAASYVHYSSSDTKKNQVSGSVSFLKDNGLNLTLAGGNREHDASARDDATFYYAKLGYIAKLFAVGTTAFAIDYGNYEDINQDDDEGDTYAVMCVQKLKDWNTDLFLGYRHYELDRAGTDFDDIDAVMCGIRIKF